MSDKIDNGGFTGIAAAPQWIYDTVFSGTNGEILRLQHDGKIIVNGDPDEAAKIFLQRLSEVYGTLPHRLEEAKEEITKLRMFIKSIGFDETIPGVFKGRKLL